MEEYNNEEQIEESIEEAPKKEGGSGSMIGSIIVIIVIIIGGLYFWGSRDKVEEDVVIDPTQNTDENVMMVENLNDATQPVEEDTTTE